MQTLLIRHHRGVECSWPSSGTADTASYPQYIFDLLFYACLYNACRKKTVRGDMGTAHGTDGSMTTETLLEDLRPELRRLRLEGWCRTVTGIAGLLMLSWLCYRYWPDISAGGLALGFLLISIFVPTVGSRWLSRRRTELVMPHLARMAGLDYLSDARKYIEELPRPFLPTTSVMVVRDRLSKRIGNRSVEMAEARLSTQHKELGDLFRGIVFSFEVLPEMPRFFVIDTRETEKKWYDHPSMDTGRLQLWRRLPGPDDRSYSVWLEPGQAEDPALLPVIDMLFQLPGRVRRKTALFSAHCDGMKLHIALSSGGDLLRLGGLMATDSSIKQAVAEAMQALSVPSETMSVVLEVEGKAREARGFR